MRLVQLSRHSIAFPSPEGALREPNGLSCHDELRFWSGH